VLFGSLKGINDGEEEEENPMVEVVGVELLLVLEVGSLNGMRELLLVTVELTVGLLELFELVTVGVTVEVITYGLLDTVMPLVVGGWLDVLLSVVEEEEEEMLIGVDIVDTGVDSVVVDNVDDSVDVVGTGVDVLDMELDEDATEVDVVDIRGVGDSTVDPGVLLCSVVVPCVVVSTLVGGTELDPAVVDGVVGGAVVDGVAGGIVDGGRPQMQIPHSALVVGRVEPVEVERRVVVEVDPRRWGLWGMSVVLVLDAAVELEEPLVEGPLEDVDVVDKVGVDNMVDVDTEDEVDVEDEIGEEDEAVVEPVSK